MKSGDKDPVNNPGFRQKVVQLGNRDTGRLGRAIMLWTPLIFLFALAVSWTGRGYYVLVAFLITGLVPLARLTRKDHTPLGWGEAVLYFLSVVAAGAAFIASAFYITPEFPRHAKAWELASAIGAFVCFALAFLLPVSHEQEPEEVPGGGAADATEVDVEAGGEPQSVASSGETTSHGLSVGSAEQNEPPFTL